MQTTQALEMASGQERKTVIVSQVTSMTKILFNNYRLRLYSYVNQSLRNGTLSQLTGYRIKNRIFDKTTCSFPDVSFWKNDRSSFFADVEVKLRLETCYGPRDWTGVLSLCCSFEDDFTLSLEDLVEEMYREEDDYTRLSSFLIPYYTN